jgi:hypothetical protein
MTFAEFYVAYRAEHRHPANRAFHLVAKVAMLAALAVAVVERSLLALGAVPVLGVAPCWLGHWLFERNLPTAWTRPAGSLLGALVGRLTGRGRREAGGARPYYSLLADVVMCGDMLSGWVARVRSPSVRT